MRCRLSVQGCVISVVPRSKRCHAGGSDMVAPSLWRRTVPACRLFGCTISDHLMQVECTELCTPSLWCHTRWLSSGRDQRDSTYGRVYRAASSLRSGKRCRITSATKEMACVACRWSVQGCVISLVLRDNGVQSPCGRRRRRSRPCWPPSARAAPAADKGGTKEMMQALSNVLACRLFGAAPARAKAGTKEMMQPCLIY